VEYLGVLWPAAATARPALLIAIVALITFINLLGVRPSAIFTNMFTIGKLTALLVFVIAGFFFISRSNYSTAVLPTYTQFSGTVLMLVFAFSGFEMAVIPAGEIVNPARNIPFALMSGIAIVVVLYTCIQFVAIGTLPELGTSTRPIADASRAFMGPAGAAFISVGALVSITGTLNSIALVSPRLLYAMAEDGHLPRPFASIHPRFRTPHIAIAVSSLTMLVLTLNGSFLTSAAISVVIRLVTYASTCAALISFRRDRNVPPAPFVAPFGVAAAVMALALTAWLLSNSTAKEGLTTLYAAIVGAIIFATFWILRKRARTGGQA
jgi:amino acid transporter